MFSKPIFVVAVLLLGVPAAAILCLNFYLWAPGTQAQLTAALSEAAGVPVTIQSSSILPIPLLGGMKLSGIKGEQAGRPPLFTVDSLTLRPDYAELLHGRLFIAGLVLNHPVVHLRLGELPQTQGTLRTSRTEGISRSSFGSAGSGGLSQVATSANPDASAAPAQASSISAPALPATPGSLNPSNGTISSPSETSLRHLVIKNGVFTLLDERGTPLIAATGIHLKGAHDEARGWSGALLASQSVLSDRLVLSNLQTPVRLTENLKTLSLDGLTALLGHGKLAGTASFDLSMGAPRYTLAVTLAGASLKQLMADSSFGASSAEGIIAGDLKLSGTAGEGSSIQGKGGLFAKEATIQPVDFLKQIGQLLNVEELKLLRLSESKCLFSLVAGRVVIDDLFLRSENLILSAKGPLKQTGELDLDSRLLFNEKLTGRLKGLLGSQLSPAPELGYSQVAFHVSGSPMNPRTDLLERLTGIKIGGDLGGILQGLFGRPKTSPQSSPSTVTPR